MHHLRMGVSSSAEYSCSCRVLRRHSTLSWSIQPLPEISPLETCYCSVKSWFLATLHSTQAEWCPLMQVGILFIPTVLHRYQRSWLMRWARGKKGDTYTSSSVGLEPVLSCYAMHNPTPSIPQPQWLASHLQLNQRSTSSSTRTVLRLCAKSFQSLHTSSASSLARA